MLVLCSIGQILMKNRTIIFFGLNFVKKKKYVIIGGLKGHFQPYRMEQNFIHNPINKILHKMLKSMSCRLEFYCLIQFQLQNEVFLA